MNKIDLRLSVTMCYVYFIALICIMLEFPHINAIIRYVKGSIHLIHGQINACCPSDDVFQWDPDTHTHTVIQQPEVKIVLFTASAGRDREYH